MPKRKLMLDTNVASKLSSNTCEFDSKHVQDKIAEDFRTVVSSQTLIELMNGVIGRKTYAHLQADQRRLRVLVGKGQPDILRFPGDYALRTVLGIESSVPKFNPADFRLWVKTILSASSQHELIDGYVRIPNRGGMFGLDKLAIAKQEREGKSSYRDFLEIAVSRTCAFPPREEWAKRIGVELEVDLDVPQSALLGERLSAAYEYQRNTFETAAANPNFNVTSHDSDWIDRQQLFYLCEPTLFLLTDDAGVVAAISATVFSC
jgi:hypothetical protein